MDSDTRHEWECASAAYAALIEKAERAHGWHSREAVQLRRDMRAYFDELRSGKKGAA